MFKRNFKLCTFLIAAFLPISCVSEKQPTVRSEFRQESRDLALILDTSGSMKENDPHRMAIYASKIFADLLEPQDRLHIISFPERDVPPDGGFPKKPGKKPVYFDDWQKNTQALGPLPAPRLKPKLEALSYTSNFTIFKEPLQVAIRALDRPESAGTRSIVFFSDGATSRGTIENIEIMKKVHFAEITAMQSMAPDLRDKSIRFFGMSLGKASSDQFQLLAEATGGEVMRVEEPRGMVDRFAEVFSKILETRVESMQFEREEIAELEIHPYVKELIILIPGGDQKTQLRFQEPGETWWKIWNDGRSLDSADAKSTNAAECVKYGLCRVDDFSKGKDGERNQYTVLRVSKPRDGTWKILVSEAPLPMVKALLIQNYDIFLEVAGERERTGWVGEANRFEARLVNSEGKVVQDPEIFEGMTYRFSARSADGQILEEVEISPDDKFRMIYDFVPPDGDAPIDVGIEATNNEWLAKRVNLTFNGVKDIHINQNSVAEFGDHVPWTDRFIETLGGAMNVLLPIWEPGEKASCTTVDFSYSAPDARGVTFYLDNSGLREKYGVSVVNEDGEPVFTIDGAEPNYQARLCLEAERSAVGGRLENAAVPIRSSTGREISGATELRINGNVKRLPFVWRVLPVWLPLEIFIALKLLKGIVFWWACGFSSGDRLREDVQWSGGRRKTSQRIFYPGLLGLQIYRIPLAARVLSLPYYMVMSFFNFIRVIWVLLKWEYPPTKKTIQQCTAASTSGSDRQRKKPLFDSSERGRLIRGALLWDGLLFSIWMGPFWRPRCAVGKRIVATKLMGETYFAKAAGEESSTDKWQVRGREIIFKERSIFRYRFDR